MNCNQYRSLLSEKIDGGLTPSQVVEIEQHGAVCRNCRTVYANFRTVIEQSQQLPLFTPDARLWTRLNAECEAEGLIREAEAPTWKWNWRAWFQLETWPQLGAALSTLAILLMVATVWTFHGVRIGPSVSSEDAAQEAQVSSEVKIAEQNYLQAIDSLEKISQSRIAQLDPSIRVVLEDNLATIDYYIDKCRESVKNDPNNALAQRYLLEAYRKKVDLLASIVHSDVL
ncbi:MAG: zf-HC2 domain-containing protein [Acidobacteriia bacterium]|nr:zf-HC2 domain-containing protein [Terriglobia bacterium]